jgi:hypothetical protein
MRLSRATARHYRELADGYSRTTGQAEYQAADVIVWALGRRQLEMSPEDIRDYHTQRLSEALRSEKTVDGRGRQVRLRHCVESAVLNDDGVVRQRCLWAHLDTARDAFLLESLLQRRREIGRDVASLRADLDFINARRAARGAPPIQMTFDFEETEEE